ncbi:MAG: hypothetical protein ABSG32_00565 [Terriglobia bacterium]|jgi:hypothetical protein
MDVKFHACPAKALHHEAALMLGGNELGLPPVWRIANMSAIFKAAARIQKNAKMKVDPEDLLKAKGRKVTKSVMADGSLKTNSLSNLPMDC